MREAEIVCQAIRQTEDEAAAGDLTQDRVTEIVKRSEYPAESPWALHFLMLNEQFGFAANPGIGPRAKANCKSQNQNQNSVLPEIHRFPLSRRRRISLCLDAVSSRLSSSDEKLTVTIRRIPLVAAGRPQRDSF